MFPILQIGPLALQTPGLFIIIGIWLGLSTSERFASRFHIDPNQLYNLVLVSLLAGIWQFHWQKWAGNRDPKQPFIFRLAIRNI